MPRTRDHKQVLPAMNERRSFRPHWFSLDPRPTAALPGPRGLPVVGSLLEMWRDHGGSLEDFLMSRINDASYRDRSRITHICLYEVTILPRDLPAVTALKQRMGTGR